MVGATAGSPHASVEPPRGVEQDRECRTYPSIAPLALRVTRPTSLERGGSPVTWTDVLYVY